MLVTRCTEPWKQEEEEVPSCTSASISPQPDPRGAHDSQDDPRTFLAKAAQSPLLCGEWREEAQGREEQILNLRLRHLALDLKKQQIADYSAAANS
jgi:hypothetical protein